MDENVAVKIICSECGDGYYYDAWVDDDTLICGACDHTITKADLVLEPGERLYVLGSGVVAYLPADD